MALQVNIRLTAAGLGTGPFDIYDNLDLVNPIANNVSKNDLILGYTVTASTYATFVRIQSDSFGCTNYIDVDIANAGCPIFETGSYTGNSYYAYPNYVIPNTKPKNMVFSWSSYDRPNRFGVYDSSGLLYSTGWRGFADYPGPWGSSLDTITRGTENICFNSLTGRYILVEAGPASPSTPESDTFDWVLDCSGICPSPTPTSTVTPTITLTATVTPTIPVTPTNTQTVSPTNTMTPTPTTPTICYYYDVTIGQTDLDNATGNTGLILNNTVYIDYIDCDGNSQTVYRAVAGTFEDDLCVISTNSPNLYIYINNLQSPVGASSATNTFVECNVPPSTPTSTPTNEATPTITPTNTATPTMTTTITVTPTVSTTLPVTPTSTLTPTVSVTPSSSITPTNTVTPTITATPVVSVTPTNTVTPSITPTNTVTPSVSVTPTNTVTPSITPTRTATPSITPTNTVTPSVSVTPSNTVTPSITPTRTATPTVTITSSITATPSITPTRTATPVVSVTPTNTITPTPSITATLTPTVTPAGLQIQLSTPQNDECVACRLTTYSTVGYVAPTDTTPSVNDIVYTNSTLTNVFNGASQWFKTSWSPNATQYSIQISASGAVLAIKDCSTCPSVTPTPTLTTTPTITPTPTVSVTPSVSITPSITPTRTVTPSITATPSTTATPTPTVTPAGTQIQLSTPQLDECTACRLTTYSTVGYVSPSDTTPSVNDIVYTNSTLTNVFNGASQWFKTSWSPNATQYSIQISASGIVLDVKDCSTCPSLTPTPTVTATPTVTPSITASPSVTPSLTPTITPAGTSIQLSTPQNDNCVACRLTTYSQTRYVNPTDTTPNTGDIVYQDSTLTTVFNGNSQWFKTTWGSPTEYSIQIATNGQVLNVTNCSTCPTQTPTPTVTLTQTPTTPEASYTPTPTVTETPTETPTPSPTMTPSVDPYYYYNATEYNCGLSGDGCSEPSTGSRVIQFSSAATSTWYSNGINAWIIIGSTSGPSFDILGDILTPGNNCTEACGF